MLVGNDHGPAEADPADLAPLCAEAEFSELVDELVAEDAPRLFAVLQEYGDRADGRIAAWDMAFEDYVDVVGVDRGSHVRVPTPERATRRYRRRPHVTARVVWVNPDPARPGSQ
jgi:hypothetical protein